MSFDYKLVDCDESDIDKIIAYKLESIFEKGGEFTREEKRKIEEYVTSRIKDNLDTYKKIIVDDNLVGCVAYYFDGMRTFIDDIYIEENYRDLGIGRGVLRDIMKEGNICYLWVYKNNVRAISLYEKLGFVVEKEDKNRYMMKSLDADMLDYYDLEFTMEQLNIWLEQGVEPELSFYIDDLEYMIIPLKDQFSIQCIGKTQEIYFKSVEELFNADLFDGLRLSRDWNRVQQIKFY